jgi:hypothetical protein
MNQNYIKIPAYEFQGETIGAQYINKNSIFQIVENGKARESDDYDIYVYYSINKRIQTNHDSLNASVICEYFQGNHARAIMSQLDLS